MAQDFEIRGMEKFEKVSRELKKVGDKTLRKELYSALNRATKQPRAEAKKSARQNLPKTGGLNKRVAAARLSTKQRLVKGGNPSVKVIAKGIDQLALTDQGRVRHPVYGNRRRWVNQPIPEAEGWFTKPMEDGKPQAQREIVDALEEIAQKLARRY